MRILIQPPPLPRHQSIVMGWSNALTKARFPNLITGDVFDAFDKFMPDVYVQTGPIREIHKKAIEEFDCIHIDQTNFVPGFDHNLIGAGELSLPTIKCDIAFVGNLRDDNRDLLESIVLPLTNKYDVKVFGGVEWNIPQYVGYIEPTLLPVLYRSSKICLNVSLGRPSEREYQIAGCGGYGISYLAGSEIWGSLTFFDYVKDVDQLNSSIEMGMWWIDQEGNSDDTYVGNIGMSAKSEVMAHHTYAHRVAKFLDNARLHDAATTVRTLNEIC